MEKTMKDTIRMMDKNDGKILNEEEERKNKKRKILLSDLKNKANNFNMNVNNININVEIKNEKFKNKENQEFIYDVRKHYIIITIFYI